MRAFVTLFSEADVWFYILYILAYIALILRLFIPSHGFLGLAGMLLYMGAITRRCTAQALTSNVILLYIVFSLVLLILVVGVVHIIVNFCFGRWKRKVLANVKGNQVPLTAEGNPDYSFLIGKIGEVISDLRPSGKVSIDGKIYEVTTTKAYIYSGTKVVVHKVIAQKIIVRKL